MNRTICDVRGWGNSNPALLGHFYTGNVMSTRSMLITSRTDPLMLFDPQHLRICSSEQTRGSRIQAVRSRRAKLETEVKRQAHVFRGTTRDPLSPVATGWGLCSERSNQGEVRLLHSILPSIIVS
jgi:hypothetical protein